MLLIKKYRHFIVLRSLCVVLVGLYLGLAISLPVSAQIADKPLFLTGQGLPPNILLILDNSDSMQEGLSQGRVGFDWDNPLCVPGPTVNPLLCPSGTLYENSKGAIVKRVARNIVNNYRGQVNLGLMTYQQHAASDNRNDAFGPPTSDAVRFGTVRWRLMHRIADARFADTPNPPFYQPDHTESLNSDIKRFREPHPKLAGHYVFYNVAVPGYWRDGTNWEANDRTFFCKRNSGSSYTCYDQMTITSGTASGSSPIGSFSITLTDGMRQRGVTSWGEWVVFSELRQNEWRANSSPGPGYLHVPIGGINSDGTINQSHWDSILTKLQPQRIDYNTSMGNVMVDPTWPVIAAGLTPLEGTMFTARDYFLEASSAFFGTDQGRTGNLPIPPSCNVNTAIWLTDGLPSVDSSGTPLGTEPEQALRQARNAIEDFYAKTEERFGKGVQTFIVGFALPPGVGSLFNVTEFPTGPLDALAQAGGTERAFSAQNEAELQTVIDGLFSRIVDVATASASSVAANSTSLQSGTAIYQAGFDSRDWSGELKALRVVSPENFGDSVISNPPAWNAEDKLPAPNNRNIITWVPLTTSPGTKPLAAHGETKPFLFNNLSASMQSHLNINPDTNVADGKGAQRLNWLRGDRSNEGFTVNDLRTRSRLLGDIVYSRPLFIGAQNFGYQAFGDGGNQYFDFLTSLRSKPPLIAVAANDGKLHFFDARLPCRDGETEQVDGCSSQGGTEVFAYVPNLVIPELSALTSQNHTRDRKFTFDGSPRLGHVYDGTKWRRIVVGSLGRGGKGAYALDIDSKEVLWEVSPSTHPQLGYIIGEPVLGRAATGQWITIIPNGYGSSGGKASILILDTLTGKELKTFEPNNATLNLTDDDGVNGMFTPVAVDLNGDRRIDRIYAGDLRGNLWRYDLDGNSGTNSWGLPNFLRSGQTQLPLFQARNTADQIQPITVRPTVTKDDKGRLIVLFGTGKYFENVDNNVNSPQTQSFYGIIDDNQIVVRNETQLLTQNILAEVTEFGFNLRATTNKTLSSTHRGWVIDLVSPIRGSQGERVVEDALVRPGNRVVFSTLIPTPSNDPCLPGGGTGWIMELDAATGARLDNSPFNLTGFGFGEENFITITVDGKQIKVPPSGIQSTVGIPTRPAVIEDPQQRGQEYKLPVGSDGVLMEIIEERVGTGRRSWRQLR